MEQAINKLLDNIKSHPEEWSFSEHTASNTERHIQIWISNGVGFCKPYYINGSKVDKLSNWKLRHRKQVWNALKEVPNYLLENQLQVKK